MNSNDLRRQLSTNKAFLEKVCAVEDGKALRSLLIHATSHNINVIVKTLFHITSGNITLTSDAFALVKKAKKIAHLERHFLTHASVKQIMAKTKRERVEFLMQLKNVVPSLLAAVLK